MSHIIRTNRFRSTLCMFALVTSGVAAVGCAMEAGASFPGIAVESYPPDGYIATTEPVYYEGHATYWYGGNWYYRDGNRWSHYDREPPPLQQRRVQAAPMRRSYTPSRTRPIANTAGRPQERGRGERER
jgi:hypothetical protein